MNVPILEGPKKPPNNRWWAAGTVIWIMLVVLATTLLEDVYPKSHWVNYIPIVFGILIPVSVFVIKWAKDGQN